MMRRTTSIALVAAVLGIQACGSEDSSSSADAERPQATSSPSPEPTPSPKPEVELEVVDRTVYSDAVTLKGRVRPKSSRVSIDGDRVEVSRGHWALPVTLTKRGDTEFAVKAVRKGYLSDSTTQTITRELSSAERAEIRAEKAARRAGARALQTAESYLEMSGFSKQGLYEQLSSSAGEGYTETEAQYAVDHVDVDWNQEAVESAKSYLEMTPMSRQALIEQLSSTAGEGFTLEQATYAVNKVY